MATPIKKDPPEEEGLDILQKLANLYNWRENLAENVNPRTYDMYFDTDAPGFEDPLLGNQAVQRLYNAIVLDRKEPLRQREEDAIEEVYDPSDIDYESNVASEAERQDLLNLMLGQDQKYGSIAPAIYKPTKAKDPDAEYYRSRVTEDWIKSMLLKPQISEDKDNSDQLVDRSWYGSVLGNYTLNKGVDEKGHYISYYDIWDVNPLSADSSVHDTSMISRGLDTMIQSAAGNKPAELYGRVYYDPETLQPIEEKKYGGTVRPIKKYKVLK